MAQIDITKLNNQQKAKAVMLWKGNRYKELKSLLKSTGVIQRMCDLHCTDDMLDRHMKFWIINKDL